MLLIDANFPSRMWFPSSMWVIFFQTRCDFFDTNFSTDPNISFFTQILRWIQISPFLLKLLKSILILYILAKISSRVGNQCKNLENGYKNLENEFKNFENGFNWFLPRYIELISILIIWVKKEIFGSIAKFVSKRTKFVSKRIYFGPSKNLCQKNNYAFSILSYPEPQNICGIKM